jgi:type I restriction enzyme S subunit
MNQADIDVPDVGWVSDSVTQQIQEQSVKYGVDAKMSGYATLTGPTELPNGWITVKFGHIIELKYGKSLPGKSRDGEGFPVFGSNGAVGKHSAPLVSSEGLIVGRKGSFGEVQYSAAPFFPIDTTYFVDQFFQQPIRYWYYQLKYLPLTKLNRSTAIPGLNREDAYSLDISFPPLAEQQQIAAKLDELLAQVDTLKTRLDTIPKILKRFRQSVLVAAMTGKLTEEWRAEANITKYDIGSKLADERIKMWPGKRKYKPAISSDEIESIEFIDLPDSWLRATLDQITCSVKDGPHFSPKYQDKGIPFISGGSIRPGKIDLSISKYISEELHQELKFPKKSSSHHA